MNSIGLRLGELDPEPELAPGTLQAAGDEVTHPQLPGDLGKREVAILEQKGRMSRDHQEIAKTAEVGDDVAGEAIAKVAVARVVRQVGHRQHRHRSFDKGSNELARSLRQLGRDRQGRPVDLNREHLDRLGDVLQALRSELAHRDAESVAHRTLHGFGDTDSAWLGERLNARCDIDAVALHIGLAAEQHLADVDADAKRDRLVAVALPHRLVAEFALDRDRELQRLGSAFEQGEDAVAGHVLDMTVVVADQRSDQPDRLGHPLIRPVFVLRHEPAVAVHVGEQDRRMLAAWRGERRFGHGRGFSRALRSRRVTPLVARRL